MKIAFLIVRLSALVLGVISCTTAGFAHGGGLDRCGGHNDRKHGGYHVHNRAEYCACNPSAEGCDGASAQAAKPPAPHAVPSASPSATSAFGIADTTQTVYVTKTGTKYHRDGCGSLSQSSIPMPLGQASAKYGPCGRCKPPSLGVGEAATPAVGSPAAAVAIPNSGQCAAITKKGTRCSRAAAERSAYCWQHGGSR
jgi:hypothetical protein